MCTMTQLRRPDYNPRLELRNTITCTHPCIDHELQNSLQYCCIIVCLYTCLLLTYLVFKTLPYKICMGFKWCFGESFQGEFWLLLKRLAHKLLCYVHTIVLQQSILRLGFIEHTRYSIYYQYSCFTCGSSRKCYTATLIYLIVFSDCLNK